MCYTDAMSSYAIYLPNAEEEICTFRRASAAIEIAMLCTVGTCVWDEIQDCEIYLVKGE